MTPPLNPDTLNDERRPTVFISYHRASATVFARQLIPELERAGHACWIDTLAIEGGDEWINAIVTGINNSYALIVLVTTEALRSRWVQREIWFAEQKAKRIIPCLLQPVAPEDYFFLANYQSVSSAFADLLRALPSPPAATVRPISATAVSQRELELAYLDRLTLEELINTDKYTPLGGASQARRAEMRAVFELMPLRLGKAAHELAEPRRFENAVEEILKLRRAVLLGEPGGGKTTTLWKLAAELVERARQDAAAPIPLLIRLGRWTKAEQSLPEFIAAELGELGAQLDALLDSRRAALLLDGLNELPVAQHALKYPLVQKFIEQHQHPNLLAIVSCRKLDYTIDLKFNRIDITPLDPLRIREFVTRYLGEASGEVLFWKLLGGDATRAVWEVWQKVGASFDQFLHAPDIPKENPNVYGATSSEHDRIWQEKVRGQAGLLALARNPYMLLMLTSVYAQQQELPDNRGELFKLFVETLLQRERIPEAEQTSLTVGLARVAFEMQTRRAPNDDDKDDEGNALTVLPQAEVKAILNDRLLYLAGSASLG